MGDNWVAPSLGGGWWRLPSQRHSVPLKHWPQRASSGGFFFLSLSLSLSLSLALLLLTAHRPSPIAHRPLDSYLTTTFHHPRGPSAGHPLLLRLLPALTLNSPPLISSH